MKSAWRHFLRSKAHVVINLLGLTLGLTAALHIYLFVDNELSYDKWLPGYEQVFRLQPATTRGGEAQGWATSEGFIIPAMASSYPEIEAATRIVLHADEIAIKTGDEQYSQSGIVSADSSFFDVFPMTFIYGSSEAVKAGRGVVITREVATKFFGDTDPIGKSLFSDWGDQQVLAVVEDMPAASHLRFKVMMPMWDQADESRNMYAFYSYVRLKAGVDPKEFEARVIHDWYDKFGYADQKPASERTLLIRFKAMPLADIHLTSHDEKEFEANGSMQVVYVFIGAGILLLVIAMINYINLSSALAIRRAKEVAIRKTIGASKQMLFVRFMTESFVFTAVAVIASVAATALLMPGFSSFMGKSFSASMFMEPVFVCGILAVWFVISLLSGLYPAAILSSYDPVRALKSNTAGIYTSRSSGYLRKGLIAVQFTISALMIVASIVVSKQMYFIENKDVGFNKSSVIMVRLTEEARHNANRIKTEVARARGVVSASSSSIVPGKRVHILSVRVPDIAGTKSTPTDPDDGSRSMRVISADYDFAKTLQLKVIDGRDFAVEQPSDSAEGFIVNEAAVKDLGLTDPVGRLFEYTFQTEKKGKIIGVVKDFNFASIHSNVEPVIIHVYPLMYNYLCIRIDGSDTRETVAEIESTWKKVTDAPFNWQFLESSYDALYKTEQTTRKVVTWFMTIAMVIAGLGLFGVVTLFAQQRLKEVGIRKVLGESYGSLMGRLSREYLLLVVIGNLAAAYPSFFLTSQWLEQFAFRIDLPVSAFVFSLVVSEILAICSISWIVLKTASMNPATVLRQE